MSGAGDTVTGIHVSTCGTYTVPWTGQTFQLYHVRGKDNAVLGIVGIPDGWADTMEALCMACQAFDPDANWTAPWATT